MMSEYPHVNTSALDVANYVLSLAEADGIALDPLTLQKILYYCQCWSLREGKRLFDDETQAWKHGPVVRNVWTAYSGSGSIPAPDSERFYELAPDQKDLIQGVWESLKHLHGVTLSDWTHEPGSAWSKARGDLPPTATSRVPISLDDMAEDAAKLEGEAEQELADIWDDLSRYQQ